MMRTESLPTAQSTLTGAEIAQKLQELNTAYLSALKIHNPTWAAYKAAKTESPGSSAHRNAHAAVKVTLEKAQNAEAALQNFKHTHNIVDAAPPAATKTAPPIPTLTVEPIKEPTENSTATPQSVPVVIADETHQIPKTTSTAPLAPPIISDPSTDGPNTTTNIIDQAKKEVAIAKEEVSQATVEYNNAAKLAAAALQALDTANKHYTQANDYFANILQEFQPDNSFAELLKEAMLPDSSNNTVELRGEEGWIVLESL